MQLLKLNAGLTWILIVIALLVAEAVLSIMYWCWLSDGESGSTTIRNLGFVIVAIIGLPLAIWRSIVAQRQSETAQRGLLNERYQKGAEMLGSKVLPVRLGGIYALARLAREHPGDYHTQIMSLFCALVRHPVAVEAAEPINGGSLTVAPTFKNGENEAGNDRLLRVREDVLEVLKVFRERNGTQIKTETKGEYRLNLVNADLNHADLNHAKLNHADLNHADLNHAKLAGAELIGAKLNHANLTGADLNHAKLNHAKLNHADLNHADLNHAKLAGAKLAGAELIGAKLNHANLTGADLNHAALDHAKLNRAALDHAKLKGADMIDAEMKSAELNHAELIGAKLIDAKLNRAKLAGAKLAGAKLDHADLRNCEGLTQEQIDQATADSDAPPNLEGVVDTSTGELLVWRG